ncbi:hypothetical protein C8R43DRAFT_1123405 [Mycena crocata]|nr:hypothetical protein C8R43DRAFT_1123405 [Mycena crocata]
MLSRVRSLGPKAIANAVYGVDFAAVRESSILRGSIYLFKRLPDEITSTRNSRYKAEDYTGHIFGEVTAAFETETRGDVFLRVKCPTNASCAVKKLFGEQLDLLRSVLDTDEMTMTGRIASSWFNGSTLHSSMGPVDGCFYVGAQRTGRRAADWTVGDSRMFRVVLARYDSDNTPEITRDYWLDIHTFAGYRPNYFPRSDVAAYVCDVNGVIGSSTAAREAGPT